ncbi:DUF2283 domain-containing protein [Streptomyces sp. NPDC016309]|uniref:DUF2283 domain-containing protein n=1 Tax=Streptomyces sp. NPDC016309 TaxID=3364965 RepID=UPI0037007D4A
MRVAYDASADMAYIYLTDGIASGEAVRHVAAEDGTAVLDYDSEGRLLGIEVFGAARRLPRSLLEAAGSTAPASAPPAARGRGVDDDGRPTAP